MAEEHTSDLRNVKEGDDVTVVTSDGHIIDAHCTSYENQHADPRSGEVRETRLWHFHSQLFSFTASIIDGLRSSPDDPEFPKHTAAYAHEEDVSIGYIVDVKIHGPEVDA